MVYLLIRMKIRQLGSSDSMRRVEYIFVNPIFRKQGLARKLLQLVKLKTGKEITLQEPISPLGSKLLNSLNKWK